VVLAALGCAACAQAQQGAAGEATYSVTQFRPPETTGVLEHRCWLVDRHFLTLIEQQGQCIIRTHPGTDPNGWGTSLYLQPFVAGQEIAGGKVEAVEATDTGIRIQFGGSIPAPGGGSEASFTTSLAVSLDPEAKQISGEGEYHVRVTKTADLAGDLNLYRLASNYLQNVPLKGGGKGDTGDMHEVSVEGDGGALEWTPPLDDRFPQELYSTIRVAMSGGHNVVDSVAQGFDEVEPAYKPSFTVSLTDVGGARSMQSGAMYDTSVDPERNLPRSQLYWADNVGVVVLIQKGRVTEQHDFAVSLSSEAEAEG